MQPIAGHRKPPWTPALQTRSACALLEIAAVEGGMGLSITSMAGILSVLEKEAS